ncbi:hypothetical protein ON010_g383 [Phytophthora cinnamomi]|nr:hypothetical protein ON010_g383 [Phytophthora cinnamomi]
MCQRNGGCLALNKCPFNGRKYAPVHAGLDDNTLRSTGKSVLNAGAIASNRARAHWARRAEGAVAVLDADWEVSGDVSRAVQRSVVLGARRRVPIGVRLASVHVRLEQIAVGPELQAVLRVRAEAEGVGARAALAVDAEVVVDALNADLLLSVGARGVGNGNEGERENGRLEHGAVDWFACSSW